MLTDPAPGAAVTPDTVTTDADGHVTAQVVLGTRPGSQAGEVRALGGSGAATATATFALNAVSENANGITAVSGLDQSGPVGSMLASPLVVQVADAFGNPIPGGRHLDRRGWGQRQQLHDQTDRSGQASVSERWARRPVGRARWRPWTDWPAHPCLRAHRDRGGGIGRVDRLRRWPDADR